MIVITNELYAQIQTAFLYRCAQTSCPAIGTLHEDISQIQLKEEHDHEPNPDKVNGYTRAVLLIGIL